MQAKLRPWIWFLCWLPATTWANAMQIQPHQGGLQLVIPLHRQPTFSVYRLQHPTRLVLEFATTQSIQSQPPSTWPQGPLVKLQLKAVIRDQTRRNKLILTLHQLDDYHLELRTGSLLLTIIGATAPPTQPNVLLAKVTPTPTIASTLPPSPIAPHITTPRPTTPRPTTPRPTTPRPTTPRITTPRPTVQVRVRPRPPPKYPWRALASAGHQQWQQATNRRTALDRRDAQGLLADVSRRYREWHNQLQRTATERLRGLRPPTLDPEQLPVTEEPIARQEKRIAKAQLAADAQLQRWFPEPDPRPTDAQVAVARPLPTKARHSPPSLRIARHSPPSLRIARHSPPALRIALRSPPPLRIARRSPSALRVAMVKAPPVRPQLVPPQPLPPKPVRPQATRSQPTRLRVAARYQATKRPTLPSLPPDWERRHATQLQAAALAAHKAASREDEFHSQHQARSRKRWQTLVAQLGKRQRMAQKTAQLRQSQLLETQFTKWKTPFVAKSHQLSPIAPHRRAMDVFRLLQREHQTPPRLAIAVRKPTPAPTPTPQPTVRPQPLPVPSLPPAARQDEPPPSETDGPLPTLLDAFRSLLPIARRRPAPPKPHAAHPSGPQSGRHQLLSMRFTQSLQTDRLILTLQSPVNARPSYTLKGQGTRTLTLILHHTQAIEEEAVEPIDATMFLSYIGHVKAIASSRQELVIKLSLTQTIRAKIQQTNTQLMIVFPRYGRRF